MVKVMHSYLRAIGFSEIKNTRDMQQICNVIMSHPTERYFTQMEQNLELMEVRRDFADGMGICMIGECNEKKEFHLLHYFPYLKGSYETWEENLVINKRIDSDTYTGMCDDIRLGVSLIFFLQNVVPFVEWRRKGQIPEKDVPVVLSALSLEGKIILGTQVNEFSREKGRIEQKKKNHLIAEARKGNQEAINTLTLEDIDSFSMINRRVKKEDVYSIVASSFVPYGSESDNYSILGTIMEYSYMTNSLTGEEVCRLSIECNDLIFDLCINAKDLYGVPMVGRRFKGNIWMQGFIDFK